MYVGKVDPHKEELVECTVPLRLVKTLGNKVYTDETDKVI